MSYRIECTIYQPVPIFYTGFIRHPVIFEKTDVYCTFRDEFEEWIKNNLLGYCKIVKFTVESAVIEFEFKEDLALFELTWR